MLWAVLGFDPGLFLRVDDAPMTLLWPALGVALLAAASTMLGHIAILLLNKINGWRLLTSLLLSAVSLAFLHVLQAAITWGVASLVRGTMPLLPLIVVGLVSTAPLVWNFATALPHLGLLLGRMLEGWSFLILVIGVASAFDVSLLWSLGFSAAGWVVMQIVSRVAQRPLNWVTSRLWTLATGRPTMVTARDILAGTPITPVSQRREVTR